MSTFSVTNLFDTGAGSLRQAVLDANALGGADTIEFSSVSGTISLTSGHLEITDSLTINGPGAGLLSISGSDQSRVFYLNQAGDVSIDGLTLTGGNAKFGGGISNVRSNLTISNSVISGNTTTTTGGGIENYNGTVKILNSTISGNSSLIGGGIYNVGTLDLRDSTVSGNSADSGGGIYTDGTATITNSTVSGNSAASGGGIYNEGTATITNSTVSGNSSSNYGGGIANLNTLTITGSTVSGNTSVSGGGVYNDGTMTITGSTLSGNTSAFGGGGFNNPGSTLTITDSTLAGNIAFQYAGGLFNFAEVTITGSTLSGNTATRGAGGVFNYGSATIINSTISGNTATAVNSVGGGVFNLLGVSLDLANSTLSDNAAAFGGGIFNYNGTFNFANTIIANSVSGGDCISVGPIDTNINNLVEDGSCNPLLSGDPNLGPLQDNGGPTFTHALPATSIAVNAGNNAAIPPGITTDQRGVIRIANGTVDIGAVESVPEPSAMMGVIVLGIAGICSWWRRRK
ncbi:choice-of-anchor Q domain-containing protein [Pannus brasiliensis CCIBt3594]|uniref:Choice-of-anchor Q domain-containing protein n=1 Tax=Pannus brasiliensis CCIBt3594 TaxID=1427578 RepID=A0AAW9QZS3_9CHRO